MPGAPPRAIRGTESRHRGRQGSSRPSRLDRSIGPWPNTSDASARPSRRCGSTRDSRGMSPARPPRMAPERRSAPRMADPSPDAAGPADDEPHLSLSKSHYGAALPGHGLGDDIWMFRFIVFSPSRLRVCVSHTSFTLKPVSNTPPCKSFSPSILIVKVASFPRRCSQPWLANSQRSLY